MVLLLLPRIFLAINSELQQKITRQRRRKRRRKRRRLPPSTGAAGRLPTVFCCVLLLHLIYQNDFKRFQKIFFRFYHYRHLLSKIINLVMSNVS